MRIMLDMGGWNDSEPWAVVREEKTGWIVLAVFGEKEDAELFMKWAAEHTEDGIPAIKTALGGGGSLFMRQVIIDDK